jgi:hypothetical protein
MHICKENFTKSMETHISDSTKFPTFFKTFSIYLRSFSLLNKVKRGIAGSNTKVELMLFLVFVSKGFSMIHFTL